MTPGENIHNTISGWLTLMCYFVVTNQDIEMLH